jgi:hypothetical protein
MQKYIYEVSKGQLDEISEAFDKLKDFKLVTINNIKYTKESLNLYYEKCKNTILGLKLDCFLHLNDNQQYMALESQRVIDIEIMCYHIRDAVISAKEEKDKENEEQKTEHNVKNVKRK